MAGGQINVAPCDDRALPGEGSPDPPDALEECARAAVQGNAARLRAAAHDSLSLSDHLPRFQSEPRMPLCPLDDLGPRAPAPGALPLVRNQQRCRSACAVSANNLW